MHKFFLTLALLTPAAVNAQAIKSEKAIVKFDDATIAKIEIPELTFVENPQTIEDYDKYFYFHRTETDFANAFADISECDAYASGFSLRLGGAAYYAPSLAGAVGGAIGSAMVDAIFGSAERRKMRRSNLRRCMGYKRYSRYGSEREAWQAFNFEEGNVRVDDHKRRQYLLKQAKIASGPKPQQEVLIP